jgi:hypothetical protein
MQKEEGILPWKLLLLALSTTRSSMACHVADGNSPVNWLLEMFSTCNSQVELDDGSSRISPSRRLKLTSMATKPLGEDDFRSRSSGSSPDSELWERLRRRRPVRSPRAGEMGPWSPLPGKETSVTTPPPPPQVMPSHEQQSAAVPLLFRHDDVARPPSHESPEMKRRRELFSWSVHGLAQEAMESSSKTTGVKAELDNGMADCDCELLPAAAARFSLDEAFIVMEGAVIMW